MTCLCGNVVPRTHPSADDFRVLGMYRRVYCAWPSLHRWLVASIVRNLLHVDSGHVPDRTEFNNLKFEAAIKQIETELKATSNQVSPILSAYLFLQGVGPLLWSAVSEIKGRKVKVPFLNLAENTP
jgi:hypothetical protein